MQEADMNLWDALGISPRTALLGAVAGLVVAGLMALITFRRARSTERSGLHLDGDRGERARE
jgi:hypothetical protein